MTPAQLVCQLKDDAGQGLNKVMDFIQSEEFRGCKEADVQNLLSALSDLSTKAKSGTVLEHVADILSTVVTLKNFSEQELKAWLAAATSVVSKDGARSTWIAYLLGSAASVLSYKEEKLAPVMVSWCRLALQVLLSDDEELRTVAVSVLRNNRESILGSRKLAAHAHTAIRNYLVTPLRKWFDCNKGADALKVWSFVVNWLGETLRKSQAACINALLTIMEKGFRSPFTEIQCLTLETWKVLIDNLSTSPEMLKQTRSLKLLMTPMKNRLSPKAQVQLQGVRINWYLACQLGDALPDAFEQVCLPLLQNIATYLGEGKSPASPEDKTELKRECVYVLARLLELSSEADASRSATIPNVDIPLAALRCPLAATTLSRHIEAFEKASSAAFAWLRTQLSDIKMEAVALSIGHWLLCRALEAHDSRNVQVVSALLKLITDAMGKHLPPSASMKIIQEARSMPETVLLSHCYYSGKSGVLHGTPAFSLLELLFQPAIIRTFGTQEEFITQVQQLLTIGMKGSSWLHFAQGAVTLLERTPADVAPLGTLWLALASPLLTCIQSTQEVNQGNQLEHDFSALVAVLCFPIQHVFSVGGSQEMQSKKTIQRKWADLYRAFACCADLVPTASPNTTCHEFCRRLYVGLTPQLKEEIAYVELVCDVLVSVDSHISKSVLGRSQSGTGVSPKWGVHARHRNLTPLGNLHWYVLTLAWCLDGCSLAEKKLRDDPTARPDQAKSILLGAVQTCLRLVQELFQCLSCSLLVEETLKLLGPSLAPFFAVTKKKLANKGFTTSITPKLEVVWSALVTSTVTNYLGPRDGSLLPALAPLLESTLLHPRATINDRAVQLWHALFAQTNTPLDIPPSLKEVLLKTRPCLLPGFVPVDDFASSCQATCSSQDNLFIPDAKLPELPKSEHAITMPPPEPTVPHPTTPKQAKRRLEDMRDEEFVCIDTVVVRPVVLTEHQKEVLRERRPLPALYNNLSQDAMDSTCCSESQDPITMDAPKESPEVEKSESKALQEVIVVETEDQIVADAGEVGNKVLIEAEEIVGPSQSPQELPRAVSPVACTVPETQDLLPPVPASIPVMPNVQVVLKKINSNEIAKLKVSHLYSVNDSGSCSPKVHKPKKKLSFALKSSVSFEEAEDAAHFNSDDIVPCSQSTDEGDLLLAFSVPQSDTDTSNGVSKDDAARNAKEKPKSEEKPLRMRKKEPTKGKRQKSPKHENGLASDFLPSSEPGALKADDNTIVLQEADCGPVPCITNESKKGTERNEAEEKVERGQEPPEEPTQGIVAAEKSEQCGNRASMADLSGESSKDAPPQKEKSARGRKRLATNVSQNRSTNGHASNTCRGRQPYRKRCLQESKPEEINGMDTKSTTVDGSKPVDLGTKQEEERASEHECESGLSQESSCASQNSVGSTENGGRLPRRRKKSPRMLEAEESDKLMKRAKRGCPPTFGTKNIRSYFLSVPEEQSKLEDCSWDSLLSVEDLQPDDGVSPLPQDNEVLVSSEATFKCTAKTYQKSSGSTLRSEKAFNVLLMEAKGEGRPLDVVVTDTEQTQPYDLLEVEENRDDTKDDGERKNYEACRVVEETEDTQACESHESLKLQITNTTTSEQPNDSSGISSQMSTEKIADLCEESSCNNPTDAAEVSNNKQDCSHAESHEHVSAPSLEPASKIEDTCHQDEISEPVSSSPCKDVDTVALDDGGSDNKHCVPDAVGHAGCTASCDLKLEQQTKNGTEVDETNDVHSRLLEVEPCEEPKAHMNGNTAEEIIIIEDNLPIKRTDEHPHPVTTVAEEKTSTCKMSTDGLEAESGNSLVLTNTEGEGDVVLSRETYCSPLSKVSGAKKRKLPFQMISPIASRLRSRQMRRSLESSEAFARGHFVEERPVTWPTSDKSDVQGKTTEQCVSPTRRSSLPGAAGPPSMSPLSRSQKMLDAAIKRMAELSPSSKAKMVLEEPAKDGEPRGYVGILKKHTTSPSRNGDAFSPKQNKRHVSFADPIVQGSSRAPRVPLKRRRSLDAFYVLRDEDLAEEIITDSQEPVCKELESCTDPVEKVIPFITTGTWASSVRQYLERQGLDTVGALSVLRPPQVQLMPLKAPKVSTLRRGLEAYLASLPSSPTCPVEEPALAPSPDGANCQVQEPVEESASVPSPDGTKAHVQERMEKLASVPSPDGTNAQVQEPVEKPASVPSTEETNTQVQEQQIENVPGEVQAVAPLLCSGVSGAEDTVVDDSKDPGTEEKPSEGNDESRKRASVDYDALSKVLDQLTPEVLFKLPYAKVVNLLENVIQVIKMRVPPEQDPA